jgi:hypothetical protein
MPMFKRSKMRYFDLNILANRQRQFYRGQCMSSPNKLDCKGNGLVLGSYRVATLNESGIPRRSTNKGNYCAADKIICISGEDEYRN